MRSTKTIGLFAACGFVLSFVAGLFSHSSILSVLLKALITAVIFGLLGFGISFVFNKFLSDGNSGDSCWYPRRGCWRTFLWYARHGLRSCWSPVLCILRIAWLRTGVLPYVFPSFSICEFFIGVLCTCVQRTFRLRLAATECYPLAAINPRKINAIRACFASERLIGHPA